MHVLSQSGAIVVELDPESVVDVVVEVVEVVEVLEVLASGSRSGATQLFASDSSAIDE
jgi:hypothetical protein